MNSKTLAAMAFAWYVCTWGGDKVAGPFNDYNACKRVAEIMYKEDVNVSPYCVVK